MEDRTRTEPAVVPLTPFREAVGETLAQRKSRAVAQLSYRNERDYDRAQATGRNKRAKKANARRSKAYRDAQVAADTLTAQIHVASGKSETASPALVANARKALAPKIAEMQERFPGLSEDEALDAMATAMEAIR